MPAASCPTHIFLPFHAPTSPPASSYKLLFSFAFLLFLSPQTPLYCLRPEEAGLDCILYVAPEGKRIPDPLAAWKQQYGLYWARK
jgi:hypothetical protein